MDIQIIPVSGCVVRNGQISRKASYVIHVEVHGRAFDVQIENDPDVPGSVLFYEPNYQASGRSLNDVIDECVEMERELEDYYSTL